MCDEGMEQNVLAFVVSDWLVHHSANCLSIEPAIVSVFVPLPQLKKELSVTCFRVHWFRNCKSVTVQLDD